MFDQIVSFQVANPLLSEKKKIYIHYIIAIIHNVGKIYFLIFQLKIQFLALADS